MKKSKEIVQHYFDTFNKKIGWEELLTDDIRFIGPAGTIEGKEPFVQMTQQFSMLVTSSSIRQIMAEDEWVSVLSRYQMALPTGDTFIMDASEWISTRDGRISSFEIHFDTAKFNEFMTKMPQQA